MGRDWMVAAQIFVNRQNYQIFDPNFVQNPGLTFSQNRIILLSESEEQKMTKKQIKEKNRKNRVLIPFNTGTRTMKSNKYPTRQKLKKMLDNY